MAVLPSTRPSRRRLALPVFLVVLLVAGGLLYWYFVAAQGPSAPGASRKPSRTVTLYFAAVNGAGLVAETREISSGLTEEEWLKATVQALIDGPTGDLVPVFPRQTIVRGVAVAGSELQVDFSRELAEAHPGGSWGELLTIQSLANTVAVSFPHLRQVRILIEGAAVETLKGHIDLRLPVSPDFTLVLRTPPNAAATSSAGKAQ